MRSSPVGLSAGRAGDRRAGRVGVQQPPAQRRRCSRAAARAPLTPAHLLAGLEPGKTQLRRPGDARRVALLVDLEADGAAQGAEVARAHGHRSGGDAVLDRRERADVDGLDGRGAVGAVVVAREAALGVLAPAGGVEQPPHRCAVALLPRRRERLHGRRPVVGLELLAHQVVTADRDRDGEHEEREHRAQRRQVAAPPAAAPGGRPGQEQRAGPGREPERPCASATSSGHRIRSTRDLREDVRLSEWRVFGE